MAIETFRSRVWVINLLRRQQVICPILLNRLVGRRMLHTQCFEVDQTTTVRNLRDEGNRGVG